MRIQKIILIIIIIALIFFGGFLAKAEVSQATVNYLLNASQDQWVTQGLAAAGAANLDLAYLDGFSGDNANDFAKTVLAVVAAGENPFNFANQNLIDGLLNYHNNNQIGAANLLNDDIWGILALRSSGVAISHQAVLDAKNYLLQAQNSDGGWGYSPTASSDTNDTAAAIMALLEAGLAPAAPEIISAIAYLQDAQNEDGGFGFYEGSGSDAGSAAWVTAALNKLDIDPAGWQVNGHDPLEYLASLYLENGSYKWVAGDETGSLLMTAYAAVAVSGLFYPVAYYEAPIINPSGFHLRIEGPAETICDDFAEAATALDIIENAAAVCGYEYNIEPTGFGPYLNMIGGLWAEGAAGWLYWVNYESFSVGAGNYELMEGDEVLWAYGEFGIQPMSISLSANQAEPDAQITATVEYYNGANWLPVNQAWVRIGDTNYQTNEAGEALFSVAQAGIYEVYAEKDNFVRTNREELVVGDGIPQTVGLSVTVADQGGGSGGGSNTLSFILNTEDLDFGTLYPGENATRQVQITNNGQVNIYLEGTVTGDQLFEDNLAINEASWENFTENIAPGNQSFIDLHLSIPNNYGGAGQKTADLIFWGSAGQ